VSITSNNQPKGKRVEQNAYIDTHRDVVEACKRGERAAQFELYRLYSKAMYNTCLRILRHESDAEDALQNAFMDIFGKLESFMYQSSVGAWMKRIVVNNCINFMKRQKVVFTEFEADTHLTVKSTEDEAIPEALLSVESIKKAMTQLSEGYRVVFSLYMIEGYDHEEIAEILHISESTSKSQLSRAKQKVRELVAK
jgi:RNA polymerase sigma-70 factor (ECF subfamily)